MCALLVGTLERFEREMLEAGLAFEEVGATLESEVKFMWLKQQEQYASIRVHRITLANAP